VKGCLKEYRKVCMCAKAAFRYQLIGGNFSELDLTGAN